MKFLATNEEGISFKHFDRVVAKDFDTIKEHYRIAVDEEGTRYERTIVGTSVISHTGFYKVYIRERIMTARDFTKFWTSRASADIASIRAKKIAIRRMALNQKRGLIDSNAF